MSNKGKGLSKDAQQWDDLIRDVHRAEQGPDTSESTPSQPADDTNDELAVAIHHDRIDNAIKRLFQATGGKVVLAAMVLLLILLALAFIPNWGTDDANTPSGAEDDVVPELDQPGAAPADIADGENAPDATNGADEASVAVVEEEALPPTHAELAAQEPIPLTEGTWRFFADASEESALYDFAFQPTGRFYEDDAEHNEGAYDLSGSTVEMTLVRVDTVTASDGVSERSQDVAWTEWFTMTRVGNTMTGTWTGESWTFGFNDGFVLRGVADRSLPGQVVFARPQRPEDPG